MPLLAGSGVPWWRATLQLAGLLAALQLTFLALVVLGAAVPAAPILENLRDASMEGRIGPDYPPDGMRGHIDGFTECTALSLAFDYDRDFAESAWRRAVTAPRVSGCATFNSWLGGEDVASGRYYRYWHGYIALSRPLLALSGVVTTRIVVFVALILSASVFVGVAARATAPWVPLALLFPLVASTNAAVTPLAFHQGLALAIALFGGAVTTLAGRKSGLLGVASAALVAGAVFAYVDVLTTPPLAWTLVTAGALVAALWRAPWPIALHFGAVAAAGWVLGYGATWVSKWLLVATVVAPSAVVDNIREVVGFRLTGASGDLTFEFGAATARNLQVWSATALGPLALGLVVGLVFAALIAAVRHRAWDALRTGAVVALPVAITPIWFEVLRNHSQIHDWFTYRSLAVSGGVLAVAAVVVIKGSYGGGRAQTSKDVPHPVI